jgi:hypothetical protein
MIYAKGGYNARVRKPFDDSTGTIFTNHVTADGYRLGAGRRFNLF